MTARIPSQNMSVIQPKTWPQITVGIKLQMGGRTGKISRLSNKNKKQIRSCGQRGWLGKITNTNLLYYNKIDSKRTPKWTRQLEPSSEGSVPNRCVL